jgi:repressor LexA
VLEFIKKFTKENKYPPTRREISNELGYKSTNAASDHLRALEKKGFLTIVPNVSRGTVLTRKKAVN